MPGQPKPDNPLHGHPAIGSLIDATGYGRAGFGADKSAGRLQREVLLTLAFADTARPQDIAGALQREPTTVRKELQALSARGLAGVTTDRADRRRRAYHILPAGIARATQLLNATSVRASYAAGIDALLGASRPMASRPRRALSPSRLPRPARPSTPAATAARLRALRRAQGVTIGELAARANVPVGVVRHMESGQRDQPFHALQRCCQALGARFVDVAGS